MSVGELTIKFNGLRIALDESAPDGRRKEDVLAYISHAHTDHTSALGGPAKIFCSDGTAELIGLTGEDRSAIPEGVSLHNAGHMLGSTQILLDTESHGKLAYTGDFKMRDGLTVKGASALQCDTLIAECTYGKPDVSFPDPAGVYSDMERWMRQNKGNIVLWGAYSTGKGQEVVKFLNDYCQIAPVVSGKMLAMCQAYFKCGVKLDFVDAAGDEAKSMMRGAFVSVLPPHHCTPHLAFKVSSAHRRRVKTALTTGWALSRALSSDIAFPLSDHADFAQLLEYCQASGAKEVFVAHGDNFITAKALREAGVNAYPIEQRLERQTKLVVSE
jgi:Cft2 family RNA processing exonuclease